MRNDRQRELERVQEKGIDVDMELVNKCAYYPLFTFTKFIDKKTDEEVQGHKFVCKNCSYAKPNKSCRHACNLRW
jgi:hypothetical protein